MAPRVSVLMAAYDSARTIRSSVESVLAQTVGDVEVIVVDDASPNEPARGALEGLDDPRLRLIDHGRNRGLSAARNTALGEARAPFVSPLDADDRWAPDYLEAVLPRFDDPEVGVVYTNARLAGHPLGQPNYIMDASVHPMDRFPKIAEQNPIPCLAATVRADALRSVRGFPEWLWAAQDYWVWCRLVKKGWRFAYVDRPLAIYQWSSPEVGGMSGKLRKVELSELKMWLAFVARYPLTPGPRRQLRYRLRRELERLLRRKRG